MKIVLASGNRHKYTEFLAFFDRLKKDVCCDFELLYAGDFERHLLSSVDVEETGDTFEENAAIKARAWASATGLPALADDSGIEVRALQGAPGIRSARAAEGSDGDRVVWLLTQLGQSVDRRACFTASLAIALPGFAVNGRDYFAAEGRCWGNISDAPKGENGFGYDPIFIPDGSAQTFGELTAAEKSKISHRAIAMKGIAQMFPSVVKYSSV